MTMLAKKKIEKNEKDFVSTAIPYRLFVLQFKTLIFNINLSKMRLKFRNKKNSNVTQAHRIKTCLEIAILYTKSTLCAGYK